MPSYPTISAGTAHGLILNSEGHVGAFGRNESQQLGVGIASANIEYPRLVKGLPFIVSIAAGANHNLALDADGNVWGFGTNSQGQLGLGVLGPNSLNAASGAQQGLGMFSPNSLNAASGAQQGLGVVSPGASNVVTVPVMNTSLPPIKSIATGGGHSLALDHDGRVWVFGANRNGQLGLGDNINRYQPAFITDIPPITAIAAGEYHSLMTDQEGRVWSFGANNYGQLGLGDTVRRNTPALIDDLPFITSLSGGGKHSLLLDEQEQVWSFGYGFSGQLGLGDHERQNRPVRIGGLPFISDISAGGSHSLVRSHDGQVWRFGEKNFIKDNFPTTELQTIPELLENLPFIASISAGDDYDLLLAEDGHILSSGKNQYGQLGRHFHWTDVPGQIPYIIAKVPPRKSPFLKFVLTVYPLIQPYLDQKQDARIHSYAGEDTIMEIDLNDTTYLARIKYGAEADSFDPPAVSDEDKYTQVFNELLKNKELRSSSFRPDFYKDEEGNEALEFEDLEGQRYLIRVRR